NNRPPEGSLLTTTMITNSTDAWYQWDITSYVQSELAAGRHVIAIALKNTSVTPNQAHFNSRQAGSNKPVVVVTTPWNRSVKSAPVARRGTAPPKGSIPCAISSFQHGRHIGRETEMTVLEEVQPDFGGCQLE